MEIKDKKGKKKERPGVKKCLEAISVERGKHSHTSGNIAKAVSSKHPSSRQALRKKYPKRMKQNKKAV